MNNEFSEHFLCSCKHPEHQLLLSYHDFPEPDDLYISMHLAKQNFFKRIWTAIKYVFGKQSDYGAFDEIILSKKDAVRMRDALIKYVASEQSKEVKRGY